MRFVPIEQVEEKAQYKFVPLDAVVPPQGKVSAPPAAIVNSEPAGGEAAGSVLNTGAAFGVYPKALPRRSTLPTPTNILKPGEPGYSVLGDMPKPAPLPVGVSPDFVNQTRAEMLRAAPDQRIKMLSDSSLRSSVVKSLLESEPQTFAPQRSGVMKNQSVSNQRVSIAFKDDSMMASPSSTIASLAVRGTRMRMTLP